jgi:hypothetical protein
MTTRYGPNQRDRLILWIATPLGLALFLSPLLANYAGFTVLPFDQHHVFGQVGGLGLVLWGLMHWKWREPARFLLRR